MFHSMPKLVTEFATTAIFSVQIKKSVSGQWRLLRLPAAALEPSLSTEADCNKIKSKR